MTEIEVVLNNVVNLFHFSHYITCVAVLICISLMTCNAEQFLCANWLFVNLCVCVCVGVVF